MNMTNCISIGEIKGSNGIIQPTPLSFQVFIQKVMRL